MSSVKCFALFSIIVFACIYAQTSLLEKYKDACEKVDIEVLLKNNHLVKLFLTCLLDEKSCNKDGLLLRSAVNEILSTNCANCSEKQKSMVQKATYFIFKERNEDFEKICDEFDPQRMHRDDIRKFMFYGTDKS